MSDSEVSVAEAFHDVREDLAFELSYYEVGPAYHLQKILSIVLAAEIGTAAVCLSSQMIWG
jgi:hypothetical protein